MRNLHNIEKSGFHRGQYVGYAGGKVWRIIKRPDGTRQARCLAPGDAKHFSILVAPRLSDLSTKLDAEG